MLEGYNEKELLSIFVDYLYSQSSQCDFKLELNSLYMVGSRVTQTNRNDSDLDIILVYSNSIKDYVMHEILNEELLYVDGIRIDFIPYKDRVELNGKYIRLL
ncbi:gp642 [Bacillus phage G]|uniref:Gp642 n=1 Tax=Bacillus phage G TaxID=2884420 RepID=G3MB22_9CAUD|nr:gp642 [Bacillus phage G]AEO93885.1 gp642 [Bacillus phage G]